MLSKMRILKEEPELSFKLRLLLRLLFKIPLYLILQVWGDRRQINTINNMEALQGFTGDTNLNLRVGVGLARKGSREEADTR